MKGTKKLRTVLISIVALIVCMFSIVNASGSKKIIEAWYGAKIVYNNVELTGDAQPFIVNGTTYVPLRMVMDAFNKNVKWDSDNNKIFINDKKENTLSKEAADSQVPNSSSPVHSAKTTIEAWYGAKIVYNNVELTGDAQPFIVNGTTYVPLRMVMDAFTKNVKWDSDNNKIFINDKKENTSSKEAGVLFTGRFDTSDPQGPRASWTGSSVKANFLGSEVSATLISYGNNWINVIVDNKVLSPVNVVGKQTVKLASDLPYALHQVEIFKRTEATVGNIQFLGFDFGEKGKLLKAPAPSSRRIEFIGDSITCGYGNEGQSGQSYQAANENGYMSYAHIAARLLNADAESICYSGKGIMRNCDGSTTELMPELYTRILSDEPSSKYDFSKWIPQAVVINLGTNDTNGFTPDKDSFVNAYTNLVKTVRSNYKSAHIYCAVGPLVGGDRLDLLRDCINTVITQQRSSGDSNIHYIEFPIQSLDNGPFGEANHPNVKTNEIMGNQLAQAISSDLGW